LICKAWTRLSSCLTLLTRTMGTASGDTCFMYAKACFYQHTSLLQIIPEGLTVLAMVASAFVATFLSS
jgi:hypothetical protein